MIKVTQDTIDNMERNYPGITEQIQHFEALELPACPVCGSSDTASVQVGIIGRTMSLNIATSKIHSILNSNNKGIHYCNVCRKQFGPTQEGKTKRLYSRPRDDSWQAFRDWVLSLTSTLTGREAVDPYPEERWKQHAQEFWSESDGEDNEKPE